jgi:hypothetical protein
MDSETKAEIEILKAHVNALKDKVEKLEEFAFKPVPVSLDWTHRHDELPPEKGARRKGGR